LTISPITANVHGRLGIPGTASICLYELFINLHASTLKKNYHFQRISVFFTGGQSLLAFAPKASESWLEGLYAIKVAS
jgi:hypothetical protein